MPIRESFLGPLANLPIGPGERSGARGALSKTEFARGCFAPSEEPGEPRIAVCFRPFQWKPDSPRLWLMTSLGLSDYEQTRQRRPWLPARFELCGAWPESDDSWQPLRDMWESGRWDLPGVPAVFSRFGELAAALARMVSGGSSFWFGDTIDAFEWWPDNEGALLATPLPELVAAGLVPWKMAKGQPQPMDLAPADWLDREKLTERHDAVFMQLAPLLPEELAAVRNSGAWEFFLDGLLASDDELNAGLDLGAQLVDPARGSRLDVFRRRQ
jgi:hypothetical protein